ncbi:MAG: MFS transporter, partial [Planctomycetia bacterium]
FLHELAMSKSHARWATSATLLAMTVGMLAGGVLTDWTRQHWLGRWGRIAIPIAGMAASAVFVVLAVAGVGRAAAVACFALSMATLGMSEAAFWVTGVELGRRWGGTTGALLNTVGNAGGLVAPVVTPLFADQMGWHWGLRLAGGLCLLGGLCWLGVAADDRPSQAAPSA